MTRKVVLVILVLALLASTGQALTFKRKVSPTNTPTFGLEKVGTGQTIVTVMWTKSSADLDLLIECDELGTVGFSISSANRHEHLAVGMADGQLCTLAVVSFQGSSTAYINIQATVLGELGTSQIRAIELSPADVPDLEMSVKRLRSAKRELRRATD